MRRFLLVGVGWLMLEVILLKGAAAFLPADSPLLRSANTASAFAGADLDAYEEFFKENFSVSQELSLLCKHEHEQNCSLVPLVDSWWRGQERDDRWLFVQAPRAPTAILFLPRKLSPASAADGPFLS